MILPALTQWWPGGGGGEAPELRPGLEESDITPGIAGREEYNLYAEDPTGDVDEAYLDKIEQARNDASKVKSQAVSAIIDLYNN